MLLFRCVDDEDTEVGPAPQPDTDRSLLAVMCADTDEWDDTDREIQAQGTIDTEPAMFEDTGVVIVAAKPSDPAPTNKLVVTFRSTESNVTFRRPTRATTAEEWPPEPRAPARQAPQIRERAFKRAGVYRIVTRPDTKN